MPRKNQRKLSVEAISFLKENLKYQGRRIVITPKSGEGILLKDAAEKFGVSTSSILRAVGLVSTTKDNRIWASSRSNYTRELKLKCAERSLNYGKYEVGSCVVCGYNKCLKSLHFHHLPDKPKSFTISGYLQSMKVSAKEALIKEDIWPQDLLEEVQKCILVCSNCHGEIHDQDIDTGYITGELPFKPEPPPSLCHPDFRLSKVEEKEQKPEEKPQIQQLDLFSIL